MLSFFEGIEWRSLVFLLLLAAFLFVIVMEIGYREGMKKGQDIGYEKGFIDGAKTTYQAIELQKVRRALLDEREQQTTRQDS